MQYSDPGGCKQYLHEGVDKYFNHGLTYIPFKKQIQFACNAFMWVSTNVFFMALHILFRNKSNFFAIPSF